MTSFFQAPDGVRGWRADTDGYPQQSEAFAVGLRGFRQLTGAIDGDSADNIVAFLSQHMQLAHQLEITRCFIRVGHAERTTGVKVRQAVCKQK
jgi:hypothetical protein